MLEKLSSILKRLLTFFLKLAKVWARSVRRIYVSDISNVPPVKCIHILALDQSNLSKKKGKTEAMEKI
jgi:hypothetical protein